MATRSEFLLVISVLERVNRSARSFPIRSFSIKESGRKRKAQIDKQMQPFARCIRRSIGASGKPGLASK